jgi:hypothetical protein
MAGIAALIVLLAVDSALLRYLATPDSRGMPGNGLKAYLMVVLPLINALVLGLPGLLGRSASRTPFLVGFESAGWAAIIAYGVACPFFPVWIGTYFNWTFPPTYNALAKYCNFTTITANELFMWFVMFPVCSIVLSVPLWGVALGGGWIGRSFGARIPSQVVPTTTPVVARR